MTLPTFGVALSTSLVKLKSATCPPTVTDASSSSPFCKPLFTSESGSNWSDFEISARLITVVRGSLFDVWILAVKRKVSAFPLSILAIFLLNNTPLLFEKSLLETNSNPVGRMSLT